MSLIYWTSTNYSTMTPNAVRMLKPHSSWMPSLDPVGLGRGHCAPLLGQSRAGLLCGNRVSSYATRGFPYDACHKADSLIAQGHSSHH